MRRQPQHRGEDSSPQRTQRAQREEEKRREEKKKRRENADHPDLPPTLCVFLGVLCVLCG
jgi:hypothetical protein